MEQSSKFLAEIEDLEQSMRNKTLFKGELDGTITIRFESQANEDFHPIHLNRSLTGIYTDNLEGGSKIYIFGFSISSIYNLLTETEYIRMYSKYKGLKIRNIAIYITSLSKMQIDSTLERKEYNTLFKREIEDIRRSHQLPRFYSGKIHSKYKIGFGNNEDSIENEGDYSSIYGLIEELEKIRNTSAYDNKAIFDIAIELTNLDDSKIEIDYELMQFYEEEDIENS